MVPVARDRPAEQRADRVARGERPTHARRATIFSMQFIGCAGTSTG